MSVKDQGGRAFPIETNDRYHLGMTLRDYFAAKALEGLLAYPNSRSFMKMSAYAAQAYRLADAMLEARDEGDEDSH